MDPLNKATALTDRDILLIAIDHLAQAKGATRPVTQDLHRQLAMEVLLDLDERIKIRTQ